MWTSGKGATLPRGFVFLNSNAEAMAGLRFRHCPTSDAPTKCDLQSEMRLLQEKGCRATEIHPRMTKVYRENVVVKFYLCLSLTVN